MANPSVPVAWLAGLNLVHIFLVEVEDEHSFLDIIYSIAVTAPGDLGDLTVTSGAGETEGTTAITVAPILGAGLAYRYKVFDVGQGALPDLDDDLTSWTEWNGQTDITADSGKALVVAEVKVLGGVAYAKSAGTVIVVANDG